MICQKCGAKLENVITDFPFKIRDNSIVIIKGLPILQCQNCNEYLIEDPIMEKIDVILDRIDITAELEILNFVA
ncbi:MAG: YgiT-type zinc finger domain-containing protein [Candidatus Fischerbacteria bacterium RBG_13_37_8]|uniref:YgiT-type zinc finger domain-containing protein n=1 Tax=Candidatus Fischerbacteria bacterium RBG_13_37_8 TaxID=1817863 RepID=A0A1F5VIT2_9BACT|nr:MAG: YgiT-type zinc finger domain-containing protein [Candidatus Fischerbacteria bacterium RBG_13_37_8]